MGVEGVGGGGGGGVKFRSQWVCLVIKKYLQFLVTIVSGKVFHFFKDIRSPE